MRKSVKLFFGLNIFLAVFSTFALAVNGEEIGIFIDANSKTITIDGNKNPNKTILDGYKVTELSAYNTDRSGFNWANFVQKGYRVEINNVNIHLSGSSLAWFVNAGIDVTLASSCYISGDGFNDFALAVIDHSETSGLITFTCGLPDANGNLKDLNKYYGAYGVLIKKGFNYIFEQD